MMRNNSKPKRGSGQETRADQWQNEQNLSISKQEYWPEERIGTCPKDSFHGLLLRLSLDHPRNPALVKQQATRRKKLADARKTWQPPNLLDPPPQHATTDKRLVVSGSGMIWGSDMQKIQRKALMKQTITPKQRIQEHLTTRGPGTRNGAYCKLQTEA